MAKKSNLPEKKVVSKATKPISKNRAYQKASAHFQEALDICVDVMRTSNNDNARLGAAKTIINKVLPDLKSQEVDGNLKVNLQYVIGLPAENKLEIDKKQ